MTTNANSGSMDEVKRCPFCGTLPRKVSGMGFVINACDSDCPAFGLLPLLEKWNRRTPAPDEQVGACECNGREPHRWDSEICCTATKKQWDSLKDIDALVKAAEQVCKEVRTEFRPEPHYGLEKALAPFQRENSK